ncbi:hypothetical protein CASFOL_007938 [Castilleja foliolosa]|uniref:NADH:quinone oxidoreductase/Mrp antiporter transmembrane domain-containing protein n=1 Tax=Castilleja foliolosa TaxID=1961234 RepID=A0ABD3E623_9LAMI
MVLIYSDNYMAHDQGYLRFFAYMSFFSTSMLGLVTSSNLIQIYIFWELVGMCSYLLIGFWFTRPPAANACQKAFVTNRVGDFGLLLGILGLYWITGSFEFRDLFEIFNNLIYNHEVNSPFVTLCATLLFAGAVAKSAQFPLHVWLPDAMEGPTPISALIHAATMVAAGVFLVARLLPLFIVIPYIMNLISLIGIITVLLGATLALVTTRTRRTQDIVRFGPQPARFCSWHWLQPAQKRPRWILSALGHNPHGFALGTGYNQPKRPPEWLRYQPPLKAGFVPLNIRCGISQSTPLGSPASTLAHQTGTGSDTICNNPDPPHPGYCPLWATTRTVLLLALATTSPKGLLNEQNRAGCGPKRTISWVRRVRVVTALAQKDIKKGLAYSTMSQLGYMMLALGMGSYRSALFHLITHAYSKALLFLGSGSVIHSMETIVGYSPDKSQNMVFMGGLTNFL